MTQIKNKVLQGILAKKVLEFQEKNSGDYLSMMTANITMIEEHYFKNIMKMFSNSLTVLFATIALFSINWLIAIVSIFLSLIPSLTPLIFNRKMMNKQEELAQANGKYSSQIKDIFNGFETIKSYQMKKIMSEKHQVSVEEVEKNKNQLNVLMGKLLGASNFTACSIQFLIILFAGYLTIKGQMTLGGTIAVTQLAGQAIAPVVELSNQMAALKSVKKVNQEFLTVIAKQAEETTGEIAVSFNDKISKRYLFELWRKNGVEEY